MYLDFPVIGYETWCIEIYTEDMDGNKKRDYDMEDSIYEELIRNTSACRYNPERRHLV